MRRIIIIVMIIFFSYSVSAQHDKDPIALFVNGHKAQVLGEYYKAIELYKASLALNQDYASPMKGLAECFYYLDEYEEALSYVQKSKKYDKTNLDLYNLEGMIQIGRGEFDLARSEFEYVLKIEPHNIDAQFGLAELDIAHGKKREAAKKFMETLRNSPNNRTALLELAGIYEDLGEYETAKSYLELALKYHSEDPWVHYTAGKYFYKMNYLRLADYYLKTAIALRTHFFEAKQLLGIVYFITGKYDDAKALMEETLVSSNPDHQHFARYCLGLFNDRTGQPLLAIEQYIKALDLKYDDEIARIASENIAKREIDIKDHIRKNLAHYHFLEGLLLEEQNYLSQALIEYRRSLMLDYDSEAARYAYAGIFKKLKFPIRYLMELKVLRDDFKSKNPEVLDEFELNLMHLYDSVSYKWREELKAVTGEESIADTKPDKEEIFDEYSIQQKRYTVLLFTEPGKNDVLHPFADRILLDYFKDLLLGYRTILPYDNEYEISSFDSAFRTANEKKSDYFFIIRIEEKERSFEIVLTLYLTRTGSEMGTVRVYKTGNRRVQDAFVKCAAEIHDLLPLRGTLLTRKSNKGIIDLGSFQGIKQGDELLIIKKSKLKLDHKKIAFTYVDSDVLGVFKVTIPDENISEGIIRKKSFFDFINPEDEIIFELKESSDIADGTDN
ncbi:MAG: tetratricopeptide repeat protein [Spirochaetales bacterium]|nr:tetratricopeptide repeat protein [Spirochaetales bacterium]